jgi:hypothetical protein
MARDPNAIEINKVWAVNGDKGIPVTIDFLEGWPIAYSLPGGPFPEREAFNEHFCNLTALGKELNQNGSWLDYSNAIDFNIGAIVRGSDGNYYEAAIANGPPSPVNPVGDVSGTWNAALSSLILVPTGTILLYPADSIPTGLLETDGSSLLRTDYVNLFATIGTTYGNVDGDHFNLPDTRGLFVRSWDNGAGIDPDAATRTDRGDGTTGDNVGTKQQDAFQGHTFLVDTYQAALPGSNSFGYGSAVNLLQVNLGNNIISDGVNGTPRITSETRANNINLVYCIKY